MLFQITPFTLSDAAIEIDPMATLARGGRHVLQERRLYDERDTFTFEAEEAHGACEEAWRRYQNIDDDHLTPDGGRSLMTGDLLRVVDAQAKVTWWICCSIGWTETFAPGDVRVEVRAPDDGGGQ